jgi:large subunit ribosomal protein L29
VTRVRELRDLGNEELVERLESSKEELFNLRFQLATGQLDNPMRIGHVRHEVARILTILRERELEEELEQGPELGREGDEPLAPAEAVEPAADEEPVAAGGGRLRRGRFRSKEEK